MISVIVPCYNSKSKLLEKCLYSISKQSYKDIEIIVVDDGSTAENIDEIRKIIAVFPNARLIEAQHGGPSSARNIGIDNAKGEYLTFVDSDDTISEWMIENLLIAIKRNNANIALGYVVGTEENKEYIFSNSKFKTEEISHEQLEKATWVGFSTEESKKGFLTCGPCAALYRTDLVYNNKFSEELEIFEDVYWNIIIFRAADKVVSIDLPVYAYRNVPGSITHTWRLFTIEKRILALSKIENELLSTKETRQWYAVRLLTNYTTSISCIMKTDELKTKSEKMRYAKELSRNTIWNLLSEKWIGKSWDIKNRVKLFLYRMHLIIPIYYCKYGKSISR